MKFRFDAARWRTRLRPLFRYALALPPGVRSLVGVIVIAAGILGVVLPVLGVWMVPLGMMFVALDIPPWRKRVEAWFDWKEVAVARARIDDP